MSGTVCENCGSTSSTVVASRSTDFRGVPVRRRRRKCHACGKATNTVELTEYQIKTIEGMAFMRAFK